jgi:hypothetical protein
VTQFYIYVKNQQMHINNICVIIYYSSPSCFSRICDHHQSIIQEYKQLYSLNISECTDMEHIKLRNVLYACGGQGRVVSIATELQDGRSGDRIPVGGEIFLTCRDQPWSPSSLVYNGYRVFPGYKERPGHVADPSPPSSAVVKKG